MAFFSTKPQQIFGLFVLLISLSTASFAENGFPKVSMETSIGTMVIELDETRAPQTVKNFLQYVDDGFYNDTIFHRVIAGFMIQGGGFDTQYQRKRTRAPVSNEAYNGLKNRRYTIAMARTTAPHSATSQFFINSEHNRNLDHTSTTQRGWGYTVFGKVVEGMEIVDMISQVRTGPGGPFGRDVPVDPIIIKNVERYSPDTSAALDGDLLQGDTLKQPASSSEGASQLEGAIDG